MKIFGYDKKGSSELLELSEVTFQIKANELKNVISFFQHVEREMEIHGKDFGHEHYKDYAEKISDNYDIIIISDAEAVLE